MAHRRFRVSRLICLLVQDQEVNYNRCRSVFFAIKILTTYETALRGSSKSKGLDALTLAGSRGFLNLYDTFIESSHHGDHLCLVLDVA